MMNLAFSGFLVGTGLILIPVILHLLKLKPRTPQAYPALMFLYATVAKRQGRNRLRKFIILLLRCFIFSLIALAFAWPYLANIAQEPEEATVILWDNSFSMQDEKVNSYLVGEAVKAVSRAGNKSPVCIGAVTESVKWSGDFSGNSNKLKQWFKDNSKSCESSSFREAILQADSKLKNISAKRKTILIITDRQFLPWENLALNILLSPGNKLKVIMPPERKSIKNTAVNKIKFQSKYFYTKQKLNLKIDFQNFNPEKASADLIVYFDKKQVQKKNISLPPNSVSSEYIQLVAPAGKPRPLAGSVELRTDNDTLRIDNVHYFSINPIAKPNIFLTPLTGKNKVDFIKTALMPTNLQGEKINAEFHDLTPDTKFDKFKDANLLLLQDLKVFGDDFTKKIDKYLELGGNVVIVWQNSPETKKLLKHFDVKVITEANKGVQRFEMLDFEHAIFKDYLKVRAGAWFDILFF